MLPPPEADPEEAAREDDDSVCLSEPVSFAAGANWARNVAPWTKSHSIVRNTGLPSGLDAPEARVAVRRRQTKR